MMAVCTPSYSILNHIYIYIYIIFDCRGTHQRATHHLCSFSVFVQKFFDFLGIILCFFQLFGIILKFFFVFLGNYFEFFGIILKFPECLSGGKNVLKSNPLDEYPYPQRRI